MAKNNSSNQDFTNNADGFDLSGGTTPRKLTLTGGNITATGSGSNTYTFPSATTTLAGLAVAQTFTAQQTFSAGINLSGTEIVTDTTTGLKIGTSGSQKIGFFNATPVVQQPATNDLGTNLANFGLRASGSNYLISTSGSTTLTGAFAMGSASRTGAVTLINTTVANNLCDATSGAFAVTLPAANARNGQYFTFKKIDSSGNAITITRAGTDTIDGATTYVLSTQYKYVTITNNNSNAWYVIANN